MYIGKTVVITGALVVKNQPASARGTGDARRCEFNPWVRKTP